MAVLVDIADAVVAELNAATFSLAFTAMRHYRPSFELADMKTLHVSVVPKGIAVAGLARSAMQHDYQIDIAVQKRLVSDDLTEIDPLVGLAEQIADHFRGQRLASYPGAVWVKTEHAPVYALEHLDQLRQLTSVLTLTFRVAR